MDQFESRARLINDEICNDIDTIETEEDAKIRIINRILTEVLGWSVNDLRTERKNENGYSDFLLLNQSSPALVVEAKRVGILDIETAEKEKVRYLKISGSSMKHIVEGVNQAASYATPNGLPVAVLTDGLCWVVFKTFVPGHNFKDKEAIVFPSLQAVLNDFSLFFDLLSKSQFGNRIYNRIFDSLHHHRLLLTQKLTPALEAADINIVQKSDLAFDLDRVFSNFFSRLTGDEDDDLLVECFVETRESRIADFSLEKMTLSVLGNIVPKDRSVDSELSSLIETSVDEDIKSKESGQNIFIVGPTGAGKTTFLDRFFKKTLPSEVRKKCVVMRVNCLDATGRDDTALQWMTEMLISSLENSIYKGVPKWEDYMALYHGDYKKRAQGVDAQLYSTDKASFKLKFGEFLEQKIETDREGYLRRMLSDVVDNRKMLPIIVVDNSDEFSAQYKKDFFQFTQALRRHTNHCLVVFPVTDKSAWSFSKTDLYGIYRSRSFFLPTPSPREVFRKRIDFLKKILTEEKGAKRDKKGYFSSRGIKVSIDDLTGFAQVLENVFVDHDYTSKTLGELTNYNIRRTLLLSQRVITSSVVNIEDLIKAYFKGESVTTNFTRFMEALLKGDYEAFKHGDNHEVFPIFQVDSEIRQSPLLGSRTLSLLQSIKNNSRSIEEQHLDVESIVGYFDAIGCSEQAIERTLVTLLENNLVEPYDVSNRDISNTQKLAITHKGVAHLRLLNNSVFFYQMALTTALTNSDISSKIASIYQSKVGFQSKVQQIKTLFLGYLVEEDGRYISVEGELEQYRCQTDLVESIIKHTKSLEVIDGLGEEYQKGSKRDGVLAVVDYFDNSKGFGFAEVDKVDGRIFFPAKMLSDFGFDSVSDGDEILCDIERGDKGLFIRKIHDIESNETEIVQCEVIRTFPDRYYGFVRVIDSERTAFFHFSIFPEEERVHIYVGRKIEANIGPDKKGEGYQVKKFLNDMA